MNTVAKVLVLIAAAGTLVACGQADRQEVAAESTASIADPAIDYAQFNTTATIRDVMNTLVDPGADALWNAVRYEMDASGSREMRPETEAQWLTLRQHAVAIIEGGNALMIPGRRVAPAGSTTDFPAYEYLPEEVEAKLQEDRQSWIGFAQGLQASAITMLNAIDARNADQLSEFGASLDAACEACHSQYWYRAESQ